MSIDNSHRTSRRSFIAVGTAIAAGTFLPRLSKAAIKQSPLIPPGALEHLPGAARKAGGASLLSAPSAYTGIQTIPSSDGFARWEWWPGTPGGSGVFSALAPDTGDISSLVTATLDQTESTIITSPATGSGAPSLSRPGRLTTGDVTKQFAFELDAVAGVSVSQIVLQIKTSNFLRFGGTSGIIGLGGVPHGAEPFDDLKLNGTTSPSSVTRYGNPATSVLGTEASFSYASWDPSDGDTSYPGGTSTFYFTYQYVWTGLSLTSTSPIALTFESEAMDPSLGHSFSVDTIQVDFIS